MILKHLSTKPLHSSILIVNGNIKNIKTNTGLGKLGLLIFSYPLGLGLFQKKRPGRGRRQAIYYSMGGWCLKFSNYMGHWCPTKSNYMGGWYFAAWKGKKKYYLPKKESSFIKSSLKKR